MKVVSDQVIATGLVIVLMSLMPTLLRRGWQAVGPLAHRQQRLDHVLRCKRARLGPLTTSGNQTTIYGRDGRRVGTVTQGR